MCYLILLVYICHRPILASVSLQIHVVFKFKKVLECENLG